VLETVLGFIILLAATAAAIAWVTSDDSPEEEVHHYTKETHLTHYPDGSIIEDELEY